MNILDASQEKKVWICNNQIDKMIEDTSINLSIITDCVCHNLKDLTQ